MKKLSIEQMEIISGGNHGRRCGLYGAGVGAAAAGGFLFPPLWGAAIIGFFYAVSEGCFD